MPEWVEAASKRAKEAFSTVLRILLTLAVLPYVRFYQRNTRDPINRLICTRTVEEADRELQSLLRVKRDETQYVQVAGAVMFASVVSCLSWNTIRDVHWSGPALWYASIVMSIAAVVVAAQQSILVSSQNKIDTSTIKARLMANPKASKPKPNGLMLFGWQSPLMLLSYSMVTFLGGLNSVVISPLAANVAWGAEAKICLTYLIFFLLTCLSFVVTSLALHRVFEEAAQ